MITNAGKAAMASRLNGSGAEPVFVQIGIGTGAVAAALTDTTLGTEVKADGTAAAGVHALSSAGTTVSRVTTTVTNDTAQITGPIAITGSIALTEAGVFNINTSGVLLCRQVFAVVNLVSTDTYTPTFTIKAA